MSGYYRRRVVGAVLVAVALAVLRGAGIFDLLASR